MIRMNLVRIIITELQEEQVIFLKEDDGTRVLPIMIGINEAITIQRYVSKQNYPRPLTHDLMGNIIHKLGFKVNRIIVSDLRHGIFYAKIILQNGSKAVEIDSRPSDAVAIATRFNAPIFVNEQVIEKIHNQKDAQFPPFPDTDIGDDEEEKGEGGDIV